LPFIHAVSLCAAARRFALSRPNDPGVFYGGDEIRTACAELGYWRWRHLCDTPAIASMPTKPQSVFRAQIAAPSVDLRVKPFVADRAAWTRHDDYAACQQFARTAREAQVGAIRYESVRDPQHRGCGAVLVSTAFARSTPQEPQTWMLSVGRERVIWRRTGVLRRQEFEFDASAWGARRARTRGAE
jgi:hypothetical protein